MAHIYGIDLGHHTVRLSVWEGSFGRMTLEGYDKAAVAQDLEAPPDILTRLAALDGLLARRERHGSDTFVMGFPTEQASVRRIELPFGDKDKVQQALPFEVENQVPFDLEDMLLAHRILDSSSFGSEVLCGMAPQQQMSDLLDMLQERNIDPKALAVDADLLGIFASQGVQVAVDFGHTRTLMTLCIDGKVVDMRALSRGGRDLTLAVAKALNVDFETAEAQKHRVGLGEEAATGEIGLVEAEWLDAEPTETGSSTAGWDDADTAADLPKVEMAAASDDVADITKEAFVALLAELRASLIALEDKHGVEVAELLICGGGSRMLGMRTLLTEVLGVPIRRVHIEAPDDGSPADATYALAHAAVSRVGDKSPLLDLRVDAFAYRGNLTMIGNVMRYSALAATALLVAGVGFFVYQTAALNAEMAEVEAEIAEAVVAAFPDVDPGKVSDPNMAQAIMMEKTAETTARQEAINAIMPEEPPILSLWAAVADNLPKHTEARVDVRELQISDGTVQLSAETDGFEDAAKIEASLQAYPRFKDARKGDEKKVKESIRFSVTIPLEADETEEG